MCGTGGEEPAGGGGGGAGAGAGGGGAGGARAWEFNLSDRVRSDYDRLRVAFAALHPLIESSTHARFKPRRDVNFFGIALPDLFYWPSLKTTFPFQI